MTALAVTGPTGVTAAPALRLTSVSRHYSTDAGVVRAIDEVTLDVAAGSSMAVTGPSGCGKSTLLGLIGALDTPTAGRVHLGGHDLSQLSEGQRARLRRREIGYLFQSDNLLPFLTALENVGLQLAVDGGDAWERSVELLDALGLADHASKLPDQLSGGQRQRVAVARALVHRPRLVLADEPTGSLDEESAAALVDVLLALPGDTGATLVVVTHDPALAARLDRTVRLRDGRLVADSAGLPLPPPGG